ncbi:gp53 minor capsid family protein [Alcaligenes sp. RM2]
MSRYRRVNIDGKSITETRVAATELLPGTFAVIDTDDKFAQAAAAVGRVYVVNCAYHQGLSIRDAVPAGDSAVGDYVEEGRELAVLCPAGAYKKDSPIKIGANGQGALATDDTDTVIGYSQDEVTLTAADFIRVRMRVGTVAAATIEP